MEPRRRELLLYTALPIVLASALLIVHSLLFNFVTDDAFISFVYSRNFARTGQLVFNVGERVEGYTNFLWTVILGILYKLRLAPEVMSRVLAAVERKLCRIIRNGNQESARRAARRPLRIAPGTVPLRDPSVASPAKNRVRSTGRARAAGAAAPPTA